MTTAKQKTVSFLLAFALILALGIGAITSTGAEPYAPGDVNGDTKVDVEDILLCRDAIFGKELSPEAFGAADVDGDGKIDIGDLLWIRDIIFGKKPPTPIATAPGPDDTATPEESEMGETTPTPEQPEKTTDAPPEETATATPVPTPTRTPLPPDFEVELEFTVAFQCPGWVEGDDMDNKWPPGTPNKIYHTYEQWASQKYKGWPVDEMEPLIEKYDAAFFEEHGLVNIAITSGYGKSMEFERMVIKNDKLFISVLLRLRALDFWFTGSRSYHALLEIENNEGFLTNVDKIEFIYT